MRDEDDRQPLVAQLLDHVQDHPGLLNAQGSGGLVEDDDLAAERCGPSDGHGLALATRGSHRLAHVLDRLDAEVLHRLTSPLLHALLVEHPQHRAQRTLATVLATEVEVARDVERGDDGQLLVDRLDPGVAGVLGLAERDRFAVQRELTGVRDVGTCEALDERRLAGAVVADDRKHLTRVEVEVHPVESDHTAEVMTRLRAESTGALS